MRRKIALLCIMLPLLTCQLHAQEVNDDEEDDTEETTKISSLLMPNAFSPNGDGINDIYKPKDGYRNIEEFHAYIYNRWGQKLYEWTLFSLSPRHKDNGDCPWGRSANPYDYWFL